MARRKGLKRWDEITTEGWLSLMADKTVMSALMMQIFSRLYHSEDYMDNAKNIAKALHLEYRALNAGVGWAGNKIREMYESGGLLTYHASEKKDETPREEETGEFRLSETPASRVRRSPWEYVFDGSEDDNGTYFWVLKPEAVRAYREIMDADIWHLDDIRQLLECDETAYGCEGSLFSHSSSHTVDEIRKRFSRNADFKRKTMGAHPCCIVCGADRISLLHAVPYGTHGESQKGLMLCPTHAALFSAHLISFSDAGELLVSPRISERERKLYGLIAGEKAKAPFSRRRMLTHRKIFTEEGRKLK
jgi:hypothetical protein